ncbi:hypothetical protein ONZ45_g1153 [Pleurotus djamor]|nr:hypothetical protein ONZ45_g1153 [Pleurotus djamor]
MMSRSEKAWIYTEIQLTAHGNFGKLSSANSLHGYNEDFGDASDGSDAQTTNWDGEVVTYGEESTLTSPPTGAHMVSHGEAKDSNTSDVSSDNEIHNDRGGEKTKASASDPSVLFWSDFARVSYIPRTIHKVPEVSDWDKIDGDWILGRDTYAQYNKDTGLMEDAVRLFLEECDSPQGLQLIEDTTTFGSFTHSFLTSFYDDFSKLPLLSFPLLSDSIPSKNSGPRYLKRMINDAFVLQGFDDIHSATCIPIQNPIFWKNTPSTISHGDFYSSSAVLCGHLETSTLPLRLKNSTSSLSLPSLLAQLNWRGTTRFSELSGICSFNASEPFNGSQPVSEFSLPIKLEPSLPTSYVCVDVTRGFSKDDLQAYETRRLRLSTTCPVKSVHAPGYPYDKSLSSLRTSQTSCEPTSLRTSPGDDSLRWFTQTKTTSGTAHLFSAYAKAIQAEITQKPSDVAQTIGVDIDTLRELVNDLWRMHDDYDDMIDLDFDSEE